MGQVSEESSSAPPEPAASLRSFVPSVYGPTALFGLGQGAVLPVLALSARELGASVATAAFVAALAGLGQLLGDLPAGAVTARVGERRAMIGASAMTAVALLGCVLAPNVALLGLAVLTTGAGTSVWGLARQSFLTEAAPVHMRARALSSLGGVQRIGTFAGPFIGALAISRWGIDGAFWVHLVAAGAAVVLLLLLPDPGRHAAAGSPGRPGPSLVAMLRSQTRVLRTLGVAALLVQAARQARLSVLPLWCEQIGLDAAATSLVVGVSGAVDMLFFYPAGSVMDRFGRAWVGVPSMVVLGLAHLALPAARTPATVVVVAIAMGIGNGMGAGLVMTLGADASPPLGRATFLGAWRLVSDTGGFAGPLLVAGIAAVAPLAAASVAVGVVAIGGASALGAWIPPPPTRQPVGRSSV